MESTGDVSLFAKRSARVEISSKKISRGVFTILYAGFWKRFVAIGIDVVILSISYLIISFILSIVIVGIVHLTDNSFESEVSISSLLPVIFQLLSGLTTWLYFGLFEKSKYQATLGKMILGIKVVNRSMERIGFGRAVARYWLRLLCNLTLGIGYIVIGFTKYKQGIHDMIAGTYIVNNRALDNYLYEQQYQSQTEYPLNLNKNS